MQIPGKLFFHSWTGGKNNKVLGWQILTLKARKVTLLFTLQRPYWYGWTFLKRLSFVRTVLVYNKIEREAEICHIPPINTHVQSPHYQHCLPEYGIFVAIDKPTLIYLNPPSLPKGSLMYIVWVWKKSRMTNPLL